MKRQHHKKVIPSNRLIIVVGLAGLPLSLISALVPSSTGLCSLLALIVVLVLIADLYLSKACLDPVTIGLPKVLRLTKRKMKPVPVTVYVQKDHSISGRKVALKLGFVFPKKQFFTQSEQSLSITGTDAVTIHWPVTGIRQGHYLVSHCYLQSRSRMRFWNIQTQKPVHCDIKVYPDLFSDNAILASLYFNKNKGIHAKRFVGKGREFEKLREYEPGDSFEDIHWKATAKRGSPISKVYQVEKTQDVYVFIDASRMSARNADIFSRGRLADEKRRHKETKPSFHEETILERYITTALSIGAATEKQGDRFGLGVFSDQMIRFIPAGGGKSHYNTCRDMLYTLSPDRVTPDFSELFMFTGHKLRKRALVILLTSLDDPVIAENFSAHVHLMKRKHLVMVNMIKPATAHPLFSFKDLTSTHAVCRHLSGHLLWHDLKELERSLYRMGVGLLLHDNRQLTNQVLTHYFSIKQRQLI